MNGRIHNNWKKLSKDEARRIFFPDGRETPFLKQLTPKERDLLLLAIEKPGFTSSYFNSEKAFHVLKTKLNNKIMKAHLKGDPCVPIPIELFGVGEKWKKYYPGTPDKHRIESVKQRLCT